MDYTLLAELGRGAEGRVFLASQAELGDRLIVLKVTPSRGAEHLALARLVHTHIAPLLFAREMPEFGLRLLAMPFVGGTSLLEVRDQLRMHSSACTGRRIVETLARAGSERPTPGRSRNLLDRLSQMDAPTVIAWLGACLADALGHAHERGWVHLDVKPGNVLLAADGMPLLLDFHLAQEQIAAGADSPESFGGTEAYMAPEQKIAGEAFCRQERSPVAVDGRADLYALGVMLIELLTGERPKVANVRTQLERAGASTGLAAILCKCIRPDPTQRYPKAAMLADDLRRHLAHRLLRGVPNRNLRERWRKWRRRNPGLTTRLGLSALLVVALTIGLVTIGRSILEKRRVLAEVIGEARQLREQGNYAAAIGILELTPRPKGWMENANQYDAELEAARREDHEQHTQRRRAALAGDLAQLANDLRWAWDLERLEENQARQLKQRCARLWARRDEMTMPRLSTKEREDLIEVALLLATLERNESRLDEAEAALGAEPVFAAERVRLASGSALETPNPVKASAWENYFAGRALLRAGQLREACAKFEAAEAARPDAVWPCFYRGVCASRLGNLQEAERAFRVCEALLPHSAEVCVNRASTLLALGKTGEARACLDRAIALQPKLGQAWHQRGVLNAREGKRREAICDFEHALQANAPVAATHYNLAVLQHEGGSLAKARRHLRLALDAMPNDADALRLQRKIEPTSQKR